MTEIIQRSHPEGITDNSWSGLPRESICYCENCAKKFKGQTGKQIPREKNWDDSTYRQWIEWNYARRLEIWDANNRATTAAGGPDCLWVGMNSGSIIGQCRSFRNLKEICRRAEILMLDHQARAESSGFQQNGEAGKLIHGLLGWDKLVPESMAMYQAGRTTFRKASMPEPEARLWMLEGFAGTIQPWWHHIGAYSEDRRQYRTVEPINRWHEANQEYLVGREPVAGVGLVWSQQNTDYYGRDNPEELVELPFRGMANALVRARIPYLPVHADNIDRDSQRFSVLVLPNLAVMTEQQCAAVRRFVQRGGNLVATGQTSLHGPWGEARTDFALADLFGAHVTQGRNNSIPADRKHAGETLHSYLRLAPELRAGYGPNLGNEPPTAESGIPFSRVSTRRTSCRSVVRWEASGPRRALRCLPPSFLPSQFIRRKSHGCACRGPTSRPSSSRPQSRAASPTCRRTSIGATPATICRTTAICWPTWSAGRRATRFLWRSTGRGSSIVISTGSTSALSCTWST